jgi:hypothetical protein
MKRFLVGIIALIAAGCSSKPAPERRMAALPNDTPRTVRAPSDPPTAVRVIRMEQGPIVLELVGVRAVVHGECPTECCRYGDWRIVAPVPVRVRPDSASPVVGTTPSGLAVRADSGVVIFDTTAVAIAGRDTVVTVGGHVWHFVAGDSLLQLTRGETASLTLWRDQLGIIEDPMFYSANAVLREVRRGSPTQWWAYVQSRSSGLAGWIDVFKTNVSGADACASSRAA